MRVARGENGGKQGEETGKESRLEDRWAEARAAGLGHELARAWEAVEGKALRAPGWPSEH